jgi:agmatine/peptidylarginine deiminase
MNFLRVGYLPLVPVFGHDVDRSMLDVLFGRCPYLTIRGLECREFAAEGGVLNFVTWPGRLGPSSIDTAKP